jgi:hypothetical protein
MITSSAFEVIMILLCERNLSSSELLKILQAEGVTDRHSEEHLETSTNRGIGVQMTLTFLVDVDVNGYGAYSQYRDKYMCTRGDDEEELMDNILEAANLALEDEGMELVREDIRLKYSLVYFFKEYKSLNASGLARRIGMNPSLLAQYATGKKSPSKKQVDRIMRGVRELGKELSRISLAVPKSPPSNRRRP